LLNDPAQRLAAFFGLQIDDDGTLALVDFHAEPHGVTRTGNRCRRINANDVSAEFSQYARGRRAGNRIGDIDHADTLQHALKRRVDCLRLDTFAGPPGRERVIDMAVRAQFRRNTLTIRANQGQETAGLTRLAKARVYQ
jgi:hypothetical protein